MEGWIRLEWKGWSAEIKEDIKVTLAVAKLILACKTMNESITIQY